MRNHIFRAKKVCLVYLENVRRTLTFDNMHTRGAKDEHHFSSDRHYFWFLFFIMVILRLVRTRAILFLKFNVGSASFRHNQFDFKNKTAWICATLKISIRNQIMSPKPDPEIVKNLLVVKFNITSLIKTCSSDHDVSNCIWIAIWWWTTIFEIACFPFYRGYKIITLY